MECAGRTMRCSHARCSQTVSFCHAHTLSVCMYVDLERQRDLDLEQQRALCHMPAPSTDTHEHSFGVAGDISFEEYCIMMSMPHDFLQSKWAPEPLAEEDRLNVTEITDDVEAREASQEPTLHWRDRPSSLTMSRWDSQELDPQDVRHRELREMFTALDIDNSGFIDPHNIREVMSRLGTTLTEDEAKKMVQIADYKQNGVIEYDEFLELMSSESSQTLHAATPDLSSPTTRHEEKHHVSPVSSKADPPVPVRDGCPSPLSSAHHTQIRAHRRQQRSWSHPTCCRRR